MPNEPESQLPQMTYKPKSTQHGVYPELSKSKLRHKQNTITTPLPINEYPLPQQVAARAAKVEYLWKQEDVHTISLSKHRYDFAFNVNMTVGDQDDLGFNIYQDPHKELLQITTCRKHTSASKI